LTAFKAFLQAVFAGPELMLTLPPVVLTAQEQVVGLGSLWNLFSTENNLLQKLVELDKIVASH
jgi:hypothetical protein